MPRIIVVTGASGGIGRASATAFGARGATVALRRPRREGPRRRRRGGRAGRRHRARDRRRRGRPGPGVRGRRAGRGRHRPDRRVGQRRVHLRVRPVRPDHTPTEYRRVTEVSYLGYVYGTMAALKYMKPRDRGTIVQVGSALAYRGIPLQTAYCGAKHAIQGFHEALRCELLHEKSNVHVTMVQMPAVNTPQFSWVLSRLPHHAQPVPPIYQPEVAARGGAVRRRPPPPTRVLGRGHAPRAPWPPTRSPPACWTATSAKTGFAAQQTNQRHDPDAPVNLWEPADGADGRDFGAHGIFDDKSHERDPQLWASHHHGLLVVVAAGVGAAAALRWLRR